MHDMKRVYQSIIAEHLQQNRQMAFISGPRQVGKTTVARSLMSDGCYLNWDVSDARQKILKGAASMAAAFGLDQLRSELPVVVLDEIHKYGKWKNLIKGFFDLYEDKCRCIVTGSARLDTYRRGGDSLLGRYFLYRMHPLSVAELMRHSVSEVEIGPPCRVGSDTIEALVEFGGFPEPFSRQEQRFYRRWSNMRLERLLQEDLRDLSQVQEVKLVQTMAEIVGAQSAQLLNYSRLACDLNISVDTSRRWTGLLESLFYCFTVRPWFRNINKSLRKQPKVYLWDWSGVSDRGAKVENMVASHLLKAVHGWSDQGLGSYELCYLRDTVGREVDFIVVKDNQPWFLVEVKQSAKRDLNPNLEYYQQLTGAKHAFQVCMDMEYVERDCFSESKPVKVPAATFFSQLV